jgi:hypothetical protein
MVVAFGVLGWVTVIVLAMLTFLATMMTAGVRLHRRRRSSR